MSIDNKDYKDLLEHWSAVASKYEHLDHKYESSLNRFSENIIYEDFYSDIQELMTPLMKEYYILLAIFNSDQEILDNEQISLYKNRVEEFIKELQRVSDEMTKVILVAKSLKNSREEY